MPSVLLVFNTKTGEQVAAVPGIVGESDDVYFGVQAEGNAPAQILGFEAEDY